MGDVTGFGLEKEEKIAVLLCSLIVRKESLLGIYSIVEVAGNFVLLVLSGTTHARQTDQFLLLPEPYGFGLAALSVNPNTAHLFPGRNSSSIEWRSWPSVRANIFELSHTMSASVSKSKQVPTKSND